MVKYEHEIGITKGTPVEKFVAGNFEGETNEVGIYLAMSRQASREGYGELAEVFKRLAWEEAEHAARFCEMNGIIKFQRRRSSLQNLRRNLRKILLSERI